MCSGVPSISSAACLLSCSNGDKAAAPNSSAKPTEAPCTAPRAAVSSIEGSPSFGVSSILNSSSISAWSKKSPSLTISFSSKNQPLLFLYWSTFI